MEHFLSSFLILAISSLCIHSPLVNAKINSFTIDLIHRNSKFSPFYNKSVTLGELHRENALQSRSRSKRFSKSTINEEKLESTLIPDVASYLMKISIGTPPVESYAIADTGSDLVWTQCNCIQCYPQDAPPFNPAASSSYKSLDCDSSECQALPDQEHGCGTSNECMYIYGYGSGMTEGNLATETFTFESTDGQTPSFPSSLFGCGRVNKGRFRPATSGIVGLGRGPLSLISRLGDAIQQTFSYCLVPLGEDTKNKLRFGKTSRGGLVSTPLLSRGGLESSFYYLNLEGASIKGNEIANSELNPGQGNIIIDSGTTFTYLNQDFYDELEAAVIQAIGLSPVQDPRGTFSLCYNTLVETEIVFRFTGADVVLKTVNLFVQLDSDLVCMAILPQRSDLPVTFGNVAQINFHVEYDLANELVSFAPQDCSQF